MLKVDTISLFAATSLFSACLAAAPAIARADYIDTLEFGLQTGYRVDDLDWNIDGISPLTFEAVDVVSELTWEDLEIYEVGASGKMAVGNDYVDFLTYLRGHVSYGWIKDGENQDSDYSGNNRTQEFSRSIATTGDDNVFDASIGLGFQWKFLQDRLLIAPLGGYSYHEQNLRDTAGIQTVSEPGLVHPLSDSAPPPVGAFPGLDSTFESEWQGPWAGIDIELTPHPRFSLLGTFEYHWAEYQAEADWNLRTDLLHPVSFSHDADDARGYLASIGGRYRFSDRFAANLKFEYQEWETDPGTIRFLGSNGSEGEQTLNEANWKSHAASVGLSYIFF